MSAPILFAPLAFALLLPPQQIELDRIVAIVDGDPIFASDIDRVISLGLVESMPGEDQRSLRRRVLDRLIDDRVRFHEVGRFGFLQVSASEVEAQLEAVRETFESDREFHERLEDLGMTEAELRQLLALQLQVLLFVEERLGPRVFVPLEEIGEYYETEVVPALEARGEDVPPIEEVREEIRAVLRAQRLNEEIERWTRNLRREADVIDQFDETSEELPPVVGVRGATPPADD